MKMKRENENQRVSKVLADSIAQEMGIEVGDVLLEINGNAIEDVFDYEYLLQDEYIEVLIRKSEGEEWLLEIDKEYEEELGIVFENGLMDDYQSCHNKCIFCFIDQMPKGMRETLYFKDDDSRLSFLQGNYITLTNMSEKDLDRIIKYRLSPINISFQTTNPQLRCEMLNNRFAGDALKKADKLFAAGIVMNGQIVLCKDVNDKAELERSIRDLSGYLPFLESVSVVPVGLSRHREGLYRLEPFTKEDAIHVISTIQKWQEKLYKEQGTHFIHASDEWYLLAELPMPFAQSYDGYLQLENGVGMLRLLQDEFREALESIQKEYSYEILEKGYTKISLATGVLAYTTIEQLIQQLKKVYPFVDIALYRIDNHFFGEQITVSGLLTGQDITDQLSGQELGQRLLLPVNVIRSGEAVLLDDYTLQDLERALQVKIDIVKSSGRDFIESILGISHTI